MINSPVSRQVSRLGGAPVISSTQRTTVETQNRHPNVGQICTEGWFISIIRVLLCGCIHAYPVCSPPCAACTKHVIHGDVIRIPPSLAPNFLSSLLLREGKKKKIHSNESRDCVWKSNMRVWVQGPPSQTQQGAGGGGKHRPGSLTPIPEAHARCF